MRRLSWVSPCLLAAIACGRVGFAVDPSGGDADAAMPEDSAGAGSVGWAATTSGTSQGSTTVSASVSVEAGDLLVALIAAKPDVAVASVTGHALSWAEIASHCAEDTQARVAAYAVRTTSPSSGMITATLGLAPASAALVLLQYRNTNAAAPTSGAIRFNHAGIDGSCGVGSLTSSYSHSISVPAGGAAFGVVVIKTATASHSFGTGFAERSATAVGGVGDRIVVYAGDRVEPVSGPTAVSGMISGGGQNEWVGLAFALEP